MSINVFPYESLGELAKLKKEAELSKTIPIALLEEASLHGWAEEKKASRTTGRSLKKAAPKNSVIQVRKPKPHGIGIADRIWSLLYKMEFSYMSSDEIVQLQPEMNTRFQQNVDIDIVSIDSDVGLGVFLRTSPEQRETDTCLAEEIRTYGDAHHQFAYAINQYKSATKQHTLKAAFIIFSCNLSISEADQQLAKEKQIVIFNEHDLLYYEDLVDRLGAAAKYQFLAEVFEDQEIPGLKAEIPAIKLKAGSKVTYYVFAIHPEHLLKISFIAHHKPGRPADLTTYQRMANKERLQEMRDYISEVGMYPTNIVVSLNRPPEFKPKRFSDQQKSQGQDAHQSEFGILILRNSYKSAWIIDGQHRLFSYSGHKWAHTASIVVIAFQDLTPRKQTEFFYDINSKQTRIDDLHLAQLQSKIYKEASNPAERILSLIPQAVAVLEQQEDSPLYQRIYFPGQTQDKKRAISSGTINDLLLDDLFTKLEYGVFYAKNDDATIERATSLLKYWFLALKQDVPSWWEAGANRGKGGLANDKGIAVFLLVLKQVLSSLVYEKRSLMGLSTQEVGELLQPYARTISRNLATFSEVDRQAFRDRCKTKRDLNQQVEIFLEVLRKEGLLSS